MWDMRCKRTREDAEKDAEEKKEKLVAESEVGQHAPLIESNREQGSWDKSIQYTRRYIQGCCSIRHVLKYITFVCNEKINRLLQKGHSLFLIF